MDQSPRFAKVVVWNRSRVAAKALMEALAAILMGSREGSKSNSLEGQESNEADGR